MKNVKIYLVFLGLNIITNAFYLITILSVPTSILKERPEIYFIIRINIIGNLIAFGVTAWFYMELRKPQEKREGVLDVVYRVDGSDSDNEA